MKHATMLALLLGVLAGCGRVESSEQLAGPNVITVHTRDYEFYAVPDTIIAGATTIRLINDGPEFHHVWLVRLEEGKTGADLLAAMAAVHKMPAWAVDVGGPNAPVPGAQSSATVNLEAGNHVMICVIPSRDGKLHVMKGMMKELTVIEHRNPPVLPQADVVLTLNDYTFSFDKPLRAGRQSIRLENAAPQSHEALLVQLAPGKTAREVLAWLQNPQGPPPGQPIGGITGLARGETNLVTHDFVPGTYALICFAPDATDGQPHVAHGMFTEFTIK
jgi:hypothetical protein